MCSTETLVTLGTSSCRHCPYERDPGIPLLAPFKSREIFPLLVPFDRGRPFLAFISMSHRSDLKSTSPGGEGGVWNFL